jgi:signal transduction histidine kinase
MPGKDQPPRSIDSTQVAFQLRFERLVSDVSSALIAAPSAEMPARIEESLRTIVEFFGVDRAGFAERSPDGRDLVGCATYGRPEVPLPLPPGQSFVEAVPWYTGELTHGRVVRFRRPSEMPPEARREREFCQRLGMRSLLAIPVLMGGMWRYVLTAGSFTSEVDWPEDLIPRLRILAEMFAHAHERARAERERERLYQAAQEAIRVRDEFITIASHELRTPCTSLQLAVQALSRKHADKAQDRRFLGTIERQVANLNVLVERLLDASFLAGGPLSLARSEVDLADIVREAVAQLQEPLRASRSALTIDAPEPVVGRWDRVRLVQVATNLVANAIKFGMGAPIELIVRAQANTATLLVRDHGIGIPLAEQARILERFERAVSSQHYGGLGLGLYISKVIVDAHGGSIEVTSRPGEGSTFAVRLPLAAA